MGNQSKPSPKRDAPKVLKRHCSQKKCKILPRVGRAAVQRHDQHQHKSTRTTLRSPRGSCEFTEDFLLRAPRSPSVSPATNPMPKRIGLQPRRPTVVPRPSPVFVASVSPEARTSSNKENAGGEDAGMVEPRTPITLRMKRRPFVSGFLLETTGSTWAANGPLRLPSQNECEHVQPVVSPTTPSTPALVGSNHMLLDPPCIQRTTEEHANVPVPQGLLLPIL